MVWYGMVWYGMVWYGMVWYGMVWYGMVWYGMVWYGMVWYGMVWYGIVKLYLTTLPSPVSPPVDDFHEGRHTDIVDIFVFCGTAFSFIFSISSKDICQGDFGKLF